MTANSRDLNDSLQATKYYLQKRFPFGYSLLQAFQIVFTESDRVKTACVTPNEVIYINGEFWLSLSLQQRAFLLTHEEFHPIFDYFIRSVNMEPELANQAHDYVINPMALEMFPDGFIKGGLLDEKYRGLSFEHVYEILSEEQKEQSGDGQPEEGGGGSGDNSGDSKGLSKGQPMSADDVPEDQVFGGDSLAGDTMPIDVIDEADSDDGKGARKEALTEDELEEKAERYRSLMTRALEFSDMQQGRMPGDLRTLVETKIENRVDWTVQLRTALGEHFGQPQADYSRFHRRTGWGGDSLVKPAESFTALDVALYFDTSGSISVDQLERGFGEAQEIVRNSNGRVRLLSGDDGITSDDYIDDMPEGVDGGGGTSFVPLFDHLELYPDKTKAVVIFTDTWGEMPDYIPNIPVYWAVFEECVEYGIQVPFGEVIEIPREA